MIAMNYRMIARVLGTLLLVLAGLLLLPLAAGLLYHESVLGFAVTIAASAVCGAGLLCVRPKSDVLVAKDGFVIVGLGWILLSLFGALPFVISGDIPNYIDALFETASGLTTTGASVVKNVEALSRGGMFWRLFTHWIGGMGVLVFIMAVLPMSGKHSMHLMRAEIPGPVVGKLVPRARETARILYIIYLGMTVAEALLLRLGGMGWYEAILHAFATAGTGGFSTRAASIAAFDSVYIEMVISLFMFLFSVNFNLYYLLLLGRVRDVWKNEELRCFTMIVIFSIVTMAANIAPLYGGFVPALRYSVFNTLSISSTSGFGTADFTLWPEYSKWLIVLLMFIGGTAGGTAGGIKLSRVMILVKSAFAELMTIVSPRRVKRIRIGGRNIADSTVSVVYLYCTLYMLILLATAWIVSLDGYDIATNFTAALSCLSNVGPGMGLVGPAGSFAIFSPGIKLVLTLVMLIGRLEIFPILVLFIPAFWKK